MPNVHEQQPQQREPSAAQLRRTAAAIFALYSGSNDERRFNAAYVGRWEDRAAFGETLLHDYGADEYLQGVPSWLKEYTQVDSERFVRDFERSGYFFIAELHDAVYVFDAHV